MITIAPTNSVMSNQRERLCGFVPPLSPGAPLFATRTVSPGGAEISYPGSRVFGVKSLSLMLATLTATVNTSSALSTR